MTLRIPSTTNAAQDLSLWHRPRRIRHRLNIVVNAAHAIADATKGDGTRGLLVVRTRAEGETVTKEVGKGTGQGLFIAHAAVVDRHGGSLTFESAVGKGTTFVIRLPVRGNEAARSKRFPSVRPGGRAATIPFEATYGE